MMKKMVAVLAFSLLLPKLLSAAATDRPNIVILVADDLGYADTGYRGSEIETPSLDRLAAEGMDIQRFYTAPICSPTRAALMTGRNPNRLGVAYSVLLPWSSGGVHTSEQFMSESFQAAGYQTAIVGKWHLGHAQQVFHPNARGFDHFYDTCIPRLAFTLRLVFWAVKIFNKMASLLMHLLSTILPQRETLKKITKPFY